MLTATSHSGNEIKTTVTSYFTLSGMAKTKKTIISVDEDVEILEPTYTVDGNGKWCGHFGNKLGSSSIG